MLNVSTTHDKSGDGWLILIIAPFDISKLNNFWDAIVKKKKKMLCSCTWGLSFGLFELNEIIFFLNKRPQKKKRKIYSCSIYLIITCLDGWFRFQLHEPGNFTLSCCVWTMEIVIMLRACATTDVILLEDRCNREGVIME